MDRKAKDLQQSTSSYENLASFVLAEARRAGATDGDVSIYVGHSVETGVRLSEVEELQGADGRSLSFRAFAGKKSATTGTTDFRRDSLRKVVRETVALAEASGEDPFSGLPDKEDLADSIPELDLYDHSFEGLSVEKQIEFGIEAEKAARDFDKRITNSEGAGFNSRRAVTVYANSLGFMGAYEGTRFSLSASIVASEGEEKKVGYWSTAARQLSRLDKPNYVGEMAAKRALAQLGARKIESKRVPVVFDRIMASRLLGQFVSAANGAHVYRNSSFLAGKLGESVASKSVMIIDDGLMAGSLYSRPFDGEGLPSVRRVVVDQGVLSCYFMSSYAARRLDMRPNGGSTTNLYLEAGEFSPEEIIGSVDSGLYLTSVSGMGLNMATGDYSLGAAGIWIENGELAYPVSEITVASNVLDMFASIEMIGNDLQFRTASNAPTIKIGEMMVAGL